VLPVQPFSATVAVVQDHTVTVTSKIKPINDGSRWYLVIFDLFGHREIRFRYVKNI
jgi:hypothetical protein